MALDILRLIIIVVGAVLLLVIYRMFTKRRA